MPRETIVSKMGHGTLSSADSPCALFIDCCVPPYHMCRSIILDYRPTVDKGSSWTILGCNYCICTSLRFRLAINNTLASAYARLYACPWRFRL